MENPKQVWRADTPPEFIEAFREFDEADRDLSKTRLSRGATAGDILAARVRFDAADRNVNELLSLHRKKNPRKKKPKGKKKQKLWSKVKRGAKTKTGHGAIGAGAGALLLGPIGAIAGAYIGSKQHKGKKKRKKNPEPMITLTDSYARMLAECCGSPEETEAFTAIDLLVYQVLVEGQPVALSLVKDAHSDLQKLKKIQTDPVTKEVIEGFEESLEYQIEKVQNPRAFKLATEVKRGRRRKAERGAMSGASAERGARAARKSSVGRTLRSLNPTHPYLEKCREMWEGCCESMTDAKLLACCKRFEKGLKHKDLEVRKECRQGMRACKAAMKEHGVKVSPSPKKGKHPRKKNPRYSEADYRALEDLTRRDVARILREHGTVDLQEFYSEVGNKKEYTGEEVLDWLGY